MDEAQLRRELEEQRELFKTVARVLYRHECWQTLPWGVQMMLLKVIRDEVDAVRGEGR